jgi:hypothetical protein
MAIYIIKKIDRRLARGSVVAERLELRERGQKVKEYRDGRGTEGWLR